VVSEETVIRLFREAVYASEGRRILPGLLKLVEYGKELGRIEEREKWLRFLRARGIAA
jgi:hypothetical protein